jgi:uncharacterized alpha/beta hydrolase family protein
MEISQQQKVVQAANPNMPSSPLYPQSATQPQPILLDQPELKIESRRWYQKTYVVIFFAIIAIAIIGLIGGAVIYFLNFGSKYLPVVNTSMVITSKNSTMSGTQKNVSGVPVEKPEVSISRLASAYWSAVQYEDYAAAYDFFQPADKALISKTDFANKEKASKSSPKITGVNIVSVIVNGNTAIAHVMITENSGSYPFTNKFILIDGNWYKVMTDENKQFLGI